MNEQLLAQDPFTLNLLSGLSVTLTTISLVFLCVYFIHTHRRSEFPIYWIARYQPKLFDCKRVGQVVNSVLYCPTEVDVFILEQDVASRLKQERNENLAIGALAMINRSHGNEWYWFSWAVPHESDAFDIDEELLSTIVTQLIVNELDDVSSIVIQDAKVIPGTQVYI